MSFKTASGLPLPLPVLRGAMEMGATIFRPRTDVLIKKIKLKDAVTQRMVKAEVATPPTRPQSVLLHCHGGAFFAGSSRTHRALSTEMAARAQVIVYMLDYRRVPEHPYPAALDDVKKLAERTNQAGVKVQLHVYENMWHNFQMFNLLIKQADDALGEIGRFIQKLI